LCSPPPPPPPPGPCLNATPYAINNMPTSTVGSVSTTCVSMEHRCTRKHIYRIVIY
jgi:hypothetical protein